MNYYFRVLLSLKCIPINHLLKNNYFSELSTCAYPYLLMYLSTLETFYLFIIYFYQKIPIR